MDSRTRSSPTARSVRATSKLAESPGVSSPAISTRAPRPPGARRLHASGIVVTEYHSLAVAAKLVPQCVVCLLSALRYHGLTTQDPRRGLDSDRASKPTNRSVAVAGASEPSTVLGPLPSSRGIESHLTRRGSSPGLLRGQNGGRLLQVPEQDQESTSQLRALRDALRTRKATVDEIHGFAKVCRVANVSAGPVESAV